jgi:hypothetical protein
VASNSSNGAAGNLKIMSDKIKETFRAATHKWIDWLLFMFIGLKLAGLGVVADWSWWWVFSPVWIYTIYAILFVPYKK